MLEHAARKKILARLQLQNTGWVKVAERSDQVTLWHCRRTVRSSWRLGVRSGGRKKRHDQAQ